MKLLMVVVAMYFSSGLTQWLMPDLTPARMFDALLAAVIILAIND